MSDQPHDQITATRELISFAELREIAATSPVIRRHIDAIKTAVQVCPWGISGVADTAGPAAAATRVFSQPAPGYHFPDWVGALVEDILVVDALTIYPMEPTSTLVVLDGASLRPVLDVWGRLSGYWQEVGSAVPRDPEASRIPERTGAVWTVFEPGQLLYRPMWRRSYTPYGYPPVERIPADRRDDPAAVADAFPSVGQVLAHLKSVFDEILHDVFNEPDLSWSWPEVDNGDASAVLA